MLPEAERPVVARRWPRSRRKLAELPGLRRGAGGRLRGMPQATPWSTEVGPRSVLDPRRASGRPGRLTRPWWAGRP